MIQSPPGGSSTLRTGQDYPAGAGGSSHGRNTLGDPARGWGGLAGPQAPPGTAQRRRKPGPGEEVAQVPAVTCAAPGVPLPVPCLDVISGRASPGPPPPPRDTPGPHRSSQIWQREEEPLTAPGANGRGLLRQSLPGLARVGHTRTRGHAHTHLFARGHAHAQLLVCTRVCAEGHAREQLYCGRVPGDPDPPPPAPSPAWES